MSKAWKTARVDFIFSKISTSRKVKWEFTVDKQIDADAGPYGMIIRTILLTELEMDLKLCYYFNKLIMSIPIPQTLKL